jgi:predicted transcriptional regulator
MSIHPRFAQAILEGTKLVELRRVAFKRPITHVFIYETGSTGAVVGFFEVKRVLQASPKTVWKTYNGTSGLTKKEFDGYYSGKNYAVVIEVGRTYRLDEPMRLSDFRVTRPPQSFMYLCSSTVEGVIPS